MLRRLVVAWGLSAALQCAGAATWRVEVHPFESVQFSAASWLAAASDAAVLDTKPVTLAGELRLRAAFAKPR